MAMLEKKRKTLDADTFEKSIALIARHADRSVKRFYEELFRLHPAVRPLFNSRDMRAQHSKLIDAL